MEKNEFGSSGVLPCDSLYFKIMTTNPKGQIFNAAASHAVLILSLDCYGNPAHSSAASEVQVIVIYIGRRNRALPSLWQRKSRDEPLLRHVWRNAAADAREFTGTAGGCTSAYGGVAASSKIISAPCCRPTQHERASSCDDCL